MVGRNSALASHCWAVLGVVLRTLHMLSIPFTTRLQSQPLSLILKGCAVTASRREDTSSVDALSSTVITFVLFVCVC